MLMTPDSSWLAKRRESTSVRGPDWKALEASARRTAGRSGPASVLASSAAFNTWMAFLQPDGEQMASWRGVKWAKRES